MEASSKNVTKCKGQIKVMLYDREWHHNKEVIQTHMHSEHY